MEEFALTQLLKSPMIAAYPDVHTLSEKIPASLHGMFFVALQGKDVVQLRLQPDPVLDAMNTAINVAPSKMRHNSNLSVVYTGDELRALLDAPDEPRDLTQRFDNDVRITRNDGSTCDACDYYGENYAGSYLVQTALKNPDLNVVDAQRLKAILGNHKRFPENVQGSFTVDLLRNADDSLSVASFALSPNVVKKLLPEFRIRFHSHDLSMDQAGFGQLAAASKSSGRRVD